ncbi:MAG TPA: biopolymer transporter ExbD [Candidatus Krumholzibacteria bacterium]|jgi:biopolymer transport protein ExbD|nr:biopolymer transporter ExbD [Candidatus Krumholzibacteria bacterium]
MGGLDIAAHDTGGGKKKGVLSHKKKGRGRIAIDMTPFVDIAFLLLIFFMVTTVFRLPQAMELNLPPEEAEVEVAESNVFMLYVHGDGEMVYRLGTDGPLEVVQFAGLREMLHDMLKQNDKLITLVKFERTTPYHWMVDVLDEFLLGNINRYSFDAMTPEEVAEVKGGA